VIRDDKFRYLTQTDIDQCTENEFKSELICSKRRLEVDINKRGSVVVHDTTLQDIYIELPKPQKAFLTCPLYSSAIILPTHSVLTLRLDCSLTSDGLRIWSLSNIPIIPLLESGETHVLQSLNESASLLSSINTAKMDISRLDSQFQYLNNSVMKKPDPKLWGNSDPDFDLAQMETWLNDTIANLSLATLISRATAAEIDILGRELLGTNWKAIVITFAMATLVIILVIMYQVCITTRLAHFICAPMRLLSNFSRKKEILEEEKKEQRIKGGHGEDVFMELSTLRQELYSLKTRVEKQEHLWESRDISDS
jgi:hypothetical protein